MDYWDSGNIFENNLREAIERQHQPAEPARSNGLVPASVLIGLFQQSSPEWQVIFTRRTDLVERHKGQVSFPGGAADAADHDAVDTALREAYEEIGLPRSCANVIGCLREMPTVTGFLITPVVAILCWPFDVLPEKAEVDRVFSVPLSWLANPENRTERLYTRSNGSQEMVVFFQPYEDEIIWGATARILVDFIDLISGTKE